MKVLEFRVPLPYTFDDAARGIRYMILRSSELDTNASDGVCFLVRREYEYGDGRRGVYTRKKFFLYKSMPKYIRALLPKKIFTFTEEAWNEVAEVRTKYRSSYFRKFRMDTRTVLVADDRGGLDNPTRLRHRFLGARRVVPLDVVADRPSPRYYEPAHDLHLHTCARTGRPWRDDWQRTHEPVACAYKLALLDFPYALQGRLERAAAAVLAGFFLMTYRRVVAWEPAWRALSGADLDAYEARLGRALDWVPDHARTDESLRRAPSLLTAPKRHALSETSTESDAAAGISGGE